MAQKAWKLDVKGKVRDDATNELLRGAKVEITKGGAPFKTIYADNSGSFSFMLDPDNSYTITVSHNSYVSKIITISTENTPGDAEVKENFSASTNFGLFKRVPDVDFSVLDSPIGAVFFDPAENKFDYSVVDFDLKKKLEELKKAIEKQKADKEAQEKAEKEAALAKAAFTKDSLAKAEADAKKKALADAEEAKRKAAADAKAEADAKKKALADAEEAKKKAAADAEAAKAEEKKKALADAEAAKAEVKKKAEQEALDKEAAKKKAEQDELDKINAKKKAEQDELAAIAAKKKAEQDELASAAAKKKAEQEEVTKSAEAKKQAELEEKQKAIAKKKAEDEERKLAAEKAKPTAVVKNEAPVIKHAPAEKPIESAPPEVIQPENVRYDEFDFGTYHVNRTFITTGGIEIEYQKIKHQWGGIFFKRDGLDITDGTYRKEMRKYGLKAQ